MKKLRIRFILAAMGSMFAVLAAIVIGMNIWNYMNIVRSTDREIDMIVENGGSFPDRREMPSGDEPAPPGTVSGAASGLADDKPMPAPGDPAPPEPPANDAPDPERPRLSDEQPDASAETPYETRYFTVFLENGEISGTHMDNIAAIDEDQAKQYASEIMESGEKTGFINGRYRYRVSDNMVVFVDCGKRLDSFFSSLWTSILVSLAGLMVVFFLIVLTSKRIFKPVEMSERKQKQFLTDASHELKTPLAIIEANTEVMELENGESKWTESTRHQVRRLGSLVEQMVTLTRLDETDYVGNPEPVCLSEVAEKAAESFRAPAEVANKDIELDIEDGIHIRADEQSIRQLVGILLDNAVKYATENTTIRIGVSKKGKRPCLSVYNRAENLEKGDNSILFERFYRNDASRNSKTGGSGIGLSIAQSIAEKSGARITAHSEDGSSLMIRVVFPR